GRTKPFPDPPESSDGGDAGRISARFHPLPADLVHTRIAKEHPMATEVGIRELLEAGVHFGHQTRRWNPKMRRFIHGERSGIYIIDLLKTQSALQAAQAFAGETARRGGTILFVGTKKTARDAVKEVAESAGM